ncbi:DUF1385 domain-containing protein [Bacillus atrophaeus]|uniref:DUF1385 domain-containing protein n=1 Tax=Bacillus atrophaeus TaxID=1452 RepID=UPI0007C4659C|nr:DUF1385 domain-containing protein [Bacillus atrophaeus]MBU5263025.1 DUF1385 domain-containing protein [Bacillus atrophaeus]WFE12832.1 DUF1385 domain-containing protein [Bacillus atrophaeus]
MSKQKNPPAYGGQAVVEGVMFGGKRNYVTAIRRNDGSIDFFKLPRKADTKLAAFKKIPFLRGILAIIDASANGTKHLNFSSERYELDPADDETLEKEEKKGSELSMFFSIAAIGVLSFLFSKFVFTLVPVFLAELTRPVFSSDTAQIAVESLFKLILLLSYIYFLSMTPLIKRVFQYHGAEHKVINCYEQNLPITVENVQKQSRLHYRCGSSFILFTIIVGMFVYLLVPTDPLWVRILDRVALIPVVLGISFEVLQLTNKVRHIPGLKVLGYPGLWLQLLTTKEPKDDQVEVAIESFNELLRMEEISAENRQPSHVVI